MATLHFLGAAQTVTGSKFLVETAATRALVDCGLFQGLKALRLQNWEPFPVNPRRIDAVLLTHAHIDHTGYLPRLVRDGFQGPVYATPGTIALARVLLPDAARLQEEDAAYANRKGFSKHSPALPLYTEDEAWAAIRLMQPVEYRQRVAVSGTLGGTFIDAGHILGSSCLLLDVNDAGVERQVLFSGDLGHFDQPIMNDPSAIRPADYLVIESTYGNRKHPDTNVKAELARLINQTVARRGHVIIPAFAVGRAQHVLFLLRELEEEGEIPSVPVYLDSPMAAEALRLYTEFGETLDVEARALLRRHRNPFVPRNFHVAASVEDSKQATAQRDPTIVVTASGMATGGRVLHHLKERLPDRRNTVILVGFQSAGTRGRRLQDGERQVKIHGQMVPVQAQIATLDGLSAHADAGEIMQWLGGLQRPPRKVFVVHGEPEAAAALAARIRATYGWEVEAPEPGATVELA